PAAARSKPPWSSKRSRTWASIRASPTPCRLYVGRTLRMRKRPHTECAAYIRLLRIACLHAETLRQAADTFHEPADFAVRDAELVRDFQIVVAFHAQFKDLAFDGLELLEEILELI